MNALIAMLKRWKISTRMLRKVSINLTDLWYSSTLEVSRFCRYILEHKSSACNFSTDPNYEFAISTRCVDQPIHFADIRYFLTLPLQSWISPMLTIIFQGYILPQYFSWRARKILLITIGGIWRHRLTRNSIKLLWGKHISITPLFLDFILMCRHRSSLSLEPSKRCLLILTTY